MIEEAHTHHPAISVVIPAYRAQRTIRRAIDSVLSQEGVTASVIVVIDGAFDDTAKIISDYPPGRVSVIAREQNRGACATRNEGLAQVNTKYVMFLDADDLLEGPLLVSLVALLEKHGAQLGFGPMQVLFEASGVRRPEYVPDYASAEDIFRKWHLDGIFVAPCSVVWDTAFIRSIGAWDEKLTRNDDGELVMRAILKGARFVISDKGRGVYVKHSMESLSNQLAEIGSIFRANEKLLAMESSVISPEIQRHVCAGHFFSLAWLSYLHGEDELGDRALLRSRGMGFGTRGPLVYRVAFAILGLKRACRLIAVLKRVARAA